MSWIENEEYNTLVNSITEEIEKRRILEAKILAFYMILKKEAEIEGGESEFWRKKYFDYFGLTEDRV